MAEVVTIPLADCIDRHAYRINSRNLVVGVFKASDSGFVGIREKFSDRFLFTEYHYDTGAPFGTARPLEDLGPCPIEDLTEYSPSIEWKGDGTDPEWAIKGFNYRLNNQPLFDWLEAKEAEIAKACKGCGEPYFPAWIDQDDGFCMRTACWNARRMPCSECGQLTVPDERGLCYRCGYEGGPEVYDHIVAEHQAKLEAEWAERDKQREG